ncbi:hypothetical protein RUND412_003038 [Rhizina undulata]
MKRSLFLAPLEPADLPIFLGADASLYPSPLTLSTLTTWTTVAPQLSLKYVTEGADSPPPTVGVAIILPLWHHYWEQLIRGELKEWEITAEMLCGGDYSTSQNREGKGKVGFHIWHIEKFDVWNHEWGSFGPFVWDEMMRIKDQMKKVGACEGFAGISGLCVTPAGEFLFRNRFGCSESPWYTGQVVIQKGDDEKHTEILERVAWEELDGENGIKRDGKIVADYRMMSREFADDTSL